MTAHMKDRWLDIDGILVVTWDDFEKYCAFIFNRVVTHYTQLGRTVHPDYIMTIPSGGDIPAGRLYMMFLSVWPNIKYCYWDKATKKPNVDVTNCHVLVVDDLCRTGHAIDEVKAWRPEGTYIKFAVLVHHETATTHPDFAAVDMKEEKIGVFFPWKSWPISVGKIYPRREVE